MVAKFSAHNYGDTGKTFIEIGNNMVMDLQELALLTA